MTKSKRFQMWSGIPIFDFDTRGSALLATAHPFIEQIELLLNGNLSGVDEMQVGNDMSYKEVYLDLAAGRSKNTLAALNLTMNLSESTSLDTVNTEQGVFVDECEIFDFADYFHLCLYLANKYALLRQETTQVTSQNGLLERGLLWTKSGHVALKPNELPFFIPMIQDCHSQEILCGDEIKQKLQHYIQNLRSKPTSIYLNVVRCATKYLVIEATSGSQFICIYVQIPKAAQIVNQMGEDTQWFLSNSPLDRQGHLILQFTTPNEYVAIHWFDLILQMLGVDSFSSFFRNYLH